MILIIGGGIAGLSAAVALRRLSDEPMTVVDSGDPKASDVPRALLNIYRGRSAKIDPMDDAGLEAISRIGKELESKELPSGLTLNGVIRVAESKQQFARWEKQFSTSGHPSPQLWPSHRFPEFIDAPFGGFQSTRGGWVNAALHLHSLRQSLEGTATVFHDQTRVLAIEENAPPYRVVTDSIDLRAEKIINATGATSIPWYAPKHTRNVQGAILTLVLKPPNEELASHPTLGRAYVIAEHEKSRTLVRVGGVHAVDGHDAVQGEPELHSRSASFIPPLAQAIRQDLWCGVRSATPNNRPEIQTLGPGFWHFGHFAGRGFLTAHSLAEELAKRVFPNK